MEQKPYLIFKIWKEFFENQFCSARFEIFNKHRFDPNYRLTQTTGAPPNKLSANREVVWNQVASVPN